MKKSFKVLSLIAIGSSMVIGAVALSANGIFNNFIFSAKAETYNRTIVFSKASATSYSSSAGSASGLYNNTISKKTDGGNTITCTVTDSTTSISGNDNIGALRELSKVSFSSSYAIRGNAFQDISSIKVTSASRFARNVRITFNKSSNYETLNLPINGSAILDTSDRVVKTFEISYPEGNSTKTVAISSVEISYSCDTHYIDDTVLESISLSGQTTEYNVGDTISFDGVVTANYSDSSQDIVSPTDVIVPSSSTAGTKQVTVSYTEEGVTKTASYDVEISEAAAGLSGDYVGTYTALHFTSNNAGNYTYGSNTIYFTYVVSGTSITFKYSSGKNSDFAVYRLFDGGDSPVPNSTGIIVSDTRIQLITYTPNDASNLRTFNK